MAQAPKKPWAGYRVWSVLLAVDGIFVVVFGGALAAKIYQHASAPLQAANIPAPKRQRPAPIEPKAEAPAPAPAPAAPENKPEPKPAAKPEPKPEAKKVEPAKSKSDAKPKTESRKAAAVRFSLRAPKAKNVQLAGAFIMRSGKKDMVRDSDGVWATTLYLLPGRTYRYTFIVDGKKMLDPENPQSERGASLLDLP